MRLAVVASLVVHAVLAAWLFPRDRSPVIVVAAAPVAPEPNAPEPNAPKPIETITEVVLLTEPAPRPAPVRHGGVATHRAHVEAIVAPSGPAEVAPAPAPEVAAPPPGPGLFAMRPAHHGPDLFAMRPADLPPAPVGAPAPQAEGSELLPSGHGTYKTDLGGSDWRTRTSTAHVARDGTVHFENAPDFDIHVGLFGIAGKMNFDDWLLRRKHQDPYGAAKRAYLERTFDERARIAELNRAEDLAHSDIAMQRNVAAARAIPDPAARKAVLFELWDEAAEDGDDALVQAGAEARAFLVGAIRAMRPALAFTPDELAQLNAHRHSRAVFAPY
ncbi:MAG TPA: hypothetical protein VGM88_25930 [Kofleriaceae bacterium]